MPIILCLSACSIAAWGGQVWRESTFEDFKDGTLEDGGANTYFSAAGRIQTINRWDADNDGLIDLVICNTHQLSEMLDMTVYWGNGKDFDARRQTAVPASGPFFVTSGDVDGDKRDDLVVVNYNNGTTTDLPAYVYYGGLELNAPANKHGEWAIYPFRARTILPVKAAYRAAVGDLNRDGNIDIVFALSGGYYEYRTSLSSYNSPSRIFWGSKNGIDPQRFQDIEAMTAVDAAIADLNGDQWPELIFANQGSGNDWSDAFHNGKPQEFKPAKNNSYIYWGGKEGFSSVRRTDLFTPLATSVTVGDVDNDGDPDLLFTMESKGPQASGANLYAFMVQPGDMAYIYLNEGGEFDNANKIEVAASGSKDAAIADFNKDGFNDIFLSNHHIYGHRQARSWLYYGAANGFSTTNRVELSTIGAWGCSADDLNEDGWIDLVISCFRDAISYEVPSIVYWNGPGGFHESRSTPLYTRGSVGNTTGDFNGDGHVDLVFTNTSGRDRETAIKCYIYHGKPDGHYTADDRDELPGQEPMECAMADLDDDGGADVLFANTGLNEATIYWNKAGRFAPGDRSGLWGYSPVGVSVADLDRDGYLDIIVSHMSIWGPEKHGSAIYWGGADGFIRNDRSELPVLATRACAVADLNQDQHLDLIFSGQADEDPGQIFWGDGTRGYTEKRRTILEKAKKTLSPEVADFNKDGWPDIVFPREAKGDKSVFYYGNSEGKYSDDTAVEIALAAKTITVADVNLDGWLDLVCPLYKDGPNRATISRVALGGPDGFSPERSIEFETNSGTGSLVSDFNFDGYPDIFFYCHRSDGSADRVGLAGDHITDSYLYWGSEKGFGKENRYQIPAIGPHYDYGADIGDIYGRGFVFSYISSAYNMASLKPHTIRWDAQTPGKTRVLFQLRVAATEAELAEAPWLGPTGAGSQFSESGSPLDLPPGQWIQYRAMLDTSNGATSPVLEGVEIQFE